MCLASPFWDANYSHQTIVALLNTLKLEVLELIETINTVKIWIQLNIPKIEDGNNFGVSIQVWAFRPHNKQHYH